MIMLRTVVRMGIIRMGCVENHDYESQETTHNNHGGSVPISNNRPNSGNDLLVEQLPNTLLVAILFCRMPFAQGKSIWWSTHCTGQPRSLRPLMPYYHQGIHLHIVT